MSATLETPRGLDALNAEDEALLREMQQDDAPEPAPVAETTDDPGEIEIEVPVAEAAAPTPKTRSKMVPHEALHESREQTKAEKARADEAEKARVAAETKLATETAKINERLNLLTALAQQPATQPAPVAAPVIEEVPLPDVATDPIGHFQERFRRSEEARVRDLAVEAQKRTDLETIVNGLKEGTERERQVRDLQNWGIAQEQAYEAQQAAYRPAMDHLIKTRHQEMEAIGINDPQIRERMIAEDVFRIAAKARQDGANFPDRMYKAALARGFAAPAAPPAVAAAPAAAALLPPLDAPILPDARAARIEEGRENSITIGSIGAAPAARMSIERILSLPDKEFEALTTRLKAQGGDALKQLMGS